MLKRELPGPDLKRGYLALGVLLHRDEQAADRDRDRGRQRQVRDRLMGDEEELRHRRGDERRERAGAPTKVALNSRVDHGQRRQGHHEGREPQRPLWARGVGVGHEIDPEQSHAQSLHPEQQHGFRPKPLVLGPPQTDPVISGEDLSCDFPVVGLPRIPEAGCAQQRQVDRADRDHHGQARSSKRRRH